MQDALLYGVAVGAATEGDAVALGISRDASRKLAVDASALAFPDEEIACSTLPESILIATCLSDNAATGRTTGSTPAIGAVKNSALSWLELCQPAASASARTIFLA